MIRQIKLKPLSLVYNFYKNQHSLFKTTSNQLISSKNMSFSSFHSKNINFYLDYKQNSQYKSKSLINIYYKMISEDNKRITKGTEHALSTNTKIGGQFSESPNAEFIGNRQKKFDFLFEKQKEKVGKLEKKQIKITLKDGKVVDGSALETTPLTIAKEAKIKQSLVADFLVAKVKYTNRVVDISNGAVDADADLENPNMESTDYELWDLDRGLEGDCSIEFLTFEDKEGKSVFWHSSAHVLGYSIEKLYGAKLCIGPALNEGFYYDAYMGSKAISEEKDYKLIKEAAEYIIKQNYPYQRLTLTKEEALDLFIDNPFKVQLISNKIPDGGKTTAYKCGSLIDLCMGPHLKSTGVVKNIEIYKNSSCYWLGNQNNDTLQRVYGVTFPNKEEMEKWIKVKEEEARRDHRNIGKKYDYFMFNDLSPGSCFFFPDGAHLYNKLVDFMRSEYKYRGFQEVISPNMYNIRLWKTSGHYKNYHENLFMLKVENQGFGMKPMNCPGHCLMFDSKVRSYKELPIRYADFGVLHRNEISGALSGLTRVRRFQQDDAHIFIDENFISQEITTQLGFLDYVYSVFGFKYDLFLSTKPDKALGDDDLWEKAESALANALNEFCNNKGKKYAIDPKGGAFYGPKIDIKLYDALGRSHQCGTIQLDFQLPIRFNLQYRTQEQVNVPGGNEEKPKKEVKKEKEKEKKEKKEEKKESEEEVKARKLKEIQEERLRKEKLIEEGKMEVYCCDAWDPEDFIWEKNELKPGFKRPVIVHRAILGSVERMLAILIEHTEGKWPFWLSPKQAIVLTVSEKFSDYANKVKDRLNYEGYVVDVDSGKQTLNKKIFNAQTEGYNYILVVGAQEVENQTVDVRDCRAEKEKIELGKFSIPKLLGFFECLMPFSSNAKKELELKSLKEEVLSDIESLEPRLKFDLYLGGDKINEDDKKYHSLIKEGKASLPDKVQYPNIWKWYKLMESSQ